MAHGQQDEGDIDLREARVMHARTREQRRFHEVLSNPTRFISRRVEHLDLLTTSRYQWTVTLEMTIPEVDHEDESAAQRLVPIGSYSKDSSLPDLKVFDGSGRQLPVLGRRDRGQVLADVFLGSFVAGRDLPSSAAFDNLPEVHKHVINKFIREVIARPTAQARKRADFLESWMHRRGGATAALARCTAFRENLDVLCRVIVLATYVQAKPRDVVVLRCEFSEPHGEFLPWHDFHVGDKGTFVKKARMRLTWPVRFVLRVLGLIPIPVRATIWNAAETESLHFTVKGSEGLSVEDMYWETSLPATTSVLLPQYARGESATLSAHEADVVFQGSSRTRPVACFGLQLAPSSQVLSGAAIAGLIAFVLYRLSLEPSLAAGSRINPDGSTFAILLAVPGLVAGGLARLRSGATEWAAFGPRTALLVTAIIPYVVAVLLIFSPDSKSLTQEMSHGGAAWALGTSALLLWIKFCPRKPLFRSLGHRGGKDSRRLLYYRLRDARAFVGLCLCAKAAFSLWVFIGTKL